MKEIYIGKKIFTYSSYEELFKGVAFDKFFKDRDLFISLQARADEKHVKVSFGPLMSFRFKSDESSYKQWGRVINTLKERYENETIEKLTTHVVVDNEFYILSFIERVNSFFRTYVNPKSPEFIIAEEEKISTDKRDESKLQEAKIVQYLLTINETASQYGFNFGVKENDNNRSFEDLWLIDLATQKKYVTDIKSILSSSVSNYAKSEAFGYVLCGKLKMKNKAVTKKFVEMNFNMERRLDEFYYLLLVYKKDTKDFGLYELSYMDQEDVSVNPSNCLQSTFSMPLVKRTNEERYDFIFELWKTYRDKKAEGFEGL
jgi:hypothetical protein